MVCALFQYYTDSSARDSETLSKMAELPEITRDEKRLTRDLSYYLTLHKLALVEHDVTTEDGFILELVHIIDPSESDEARSKRSPVLLLHGLLQSSATFVTSGADSVGLVLMRAGFDVWLGNNRCGSVPRHIKYNRYDTRMWQWAMSEMGTKDLPALLDFVRETTGADKVALVAHSQGTTQTFCALASDAMPELHEKISCFAALAPAVYSGSLIDRWYLKSMRVPRSVYHFCMGHHSFLPIMNRMRQWMPLRLFTSLGYIMFNYLLGWDDSLWNLGYKSRQFVFSPVYVSAELMFWWLGKGGFADNKCALDETSPQWYDSTFPPLAIFAPGRDNLVNPKRLINRLRTYESIPTMEVIDLPSYSHLDVLWAFDAGRRVCVPLVEFIWKHADCQGRRPPRAAESVIHV